MGFISCAKKYPVSTFHIKNPAMQDSSLVFNQDCELVSQLPTFPKVYLLIVDGKMKTIVATSNKHAVIFIASCANLIKSCAFIRIGIIIIV